MYEELVAWLRSWSELPAHCECYESCAECDKQDLCATFTNERIITKAGEAADAIETMCEMVATAHGELANVIQSYEEIKPRWIPVTERLPEDGQWVLVWGHGQKIPIMMFRESGAWIDDQFEFHTTVTHWMPLPEPPKEE